jgi:hypothetical protein
MGNLCEHEVCEQEHHWMLHIDPMKHAQEMRHSDLKRTVVVAIVGATVATRPMNMKKTNQSSW